jgi:hypothetical protein
MMKKVIIPLVIVVIAIVGLATFIYLNKEKPCLNCGKHADNGKAQEPKFSDYFIGEADLCNVLDKETVSNLLGKTIIKTESLTRSTLKSCQYYLDETHALVLNYDLTAVDSKIKGHETLGRKITTNPKIIAKHSVVVQENGLINEIYLILGKSEFVSINRPNGKLISEDEIVTFAAKLGEIVSGIVSLPTVNTGNQSSGDTVPLPELDDSVRNFFVHIDEKSPSEAVSMLSSTITSDESVKQAWAVQFNAINHMKVINIEPANTQDWSTDRQMYKLTLDVEMNPDSKNAPIPYYGWDNGTNIRWVTLVKEAGLWRIQNIATGP